MGVIALLFVFTAFLSCSDSNNNIPNNKEASLQPVTEEVSGYYDESQPEINDLLEENEECLEEVLELAENCQETNDKAVCEEKNLKSRLCAAMDRYISCYSSSLRGKDKCIEREQGDDCLQQLDDKVAKCEQSRDFALCEIDVLSELNSCVAGAVDTQERNECYKTRTSNESSMCYETILGKKMPKRGTYTQTIFIHR